MPSDKHQLLLRYLIRKMAVDGFTLTHWDGEHAKCVGGGVVPLPLPPSLGNHRPDALCFNNKLSIWGIGEAKTENDLFTKRTERQLKQFSSARSLYQGRDCHLYLGVPQTAIQAARRILVKCGLHGKRNVHLLEVPDILLN